MTTAVSRSRTVTARIDTAPASPGGFTVTAFVSVEEFPFHGYQPASRVAEVTTVDNTSLRLLFARSRVADHHDAAATAFEVSIGHACDDLGGAGPPTSARCPSAMSWRSPPRRHRHLLHHRRRPLPGDRAAHRPRPPGGHPRDIPHHLTPTTLPDSDPGPPRRCRGRPMPAP